MRWIGKNKVFLFFLLIILLRFGLVFLPSHSDLLAQAEWGKWMYVNDNTKGLYDWNIWGCIWPNHPPLISWIYFMSYKIHSLLMMIMSNIGNFIALNRLAPTKFLWFFEFIKWFGTETYENSYFLVGVIMVIKSFMVIADLLIAGIIYYICKLNKVDYKKFVLIYLLLPFSWYLSAVWGQSDQLSFLFIIFSIILLTTKRSIWSPLLFAIALNLKPSGIILAPLYLFVWYKQKQPIRNLLLGGLLAVIFSFWTVTWFAKNNVFDLLFGILPKRLSTSEGLINLNSFNFWYMFFPFPSKVVPETIKIGLITAKNIGWLIWGIVSIYSFKFVKYKRLDTIFFSMFVVGFGGWLIMTGMHERYSFFGMVPLLFLSIYNKVYLKYFVILSSIYFLTMFYVFSVPQQLDFIKIIFNWNYQLVPRILSLINIIVYIKVIKLFINDKKQNKYY